MKIKMKKIIAMICLSLVLLTSLPIQTYAAFITDINSNAIFGVAPGSDDYGHQLHYAHYEGIDYLAFCMLYNTTSADGSEYVYNSDFLVYYKNSAPQFQAIAEMIYFGYAMNYGYGLPTNDNAIRAACCTQQYVWEALEDAPDRDSWNPDYMSSDLYETWLSQTQNYYNQYHEKVSFNGCNQKIDGQSVTLTDTTGSLAYYSSFTKEINGITFNHSHGSNDLIITADSNRTSNSATFRSTDYGIYQLMPNGTVYSAETMSNYTYFQFTSGTVQNLLVSNYVDPNFFHVTVEFESGNIMITKTNSNGDALAGCTFGIYSDANCTQMIRSATTDGAGQSYFPDLPVGNYYIKEISAPAGYLIDTNIKSVNVINGQTADVRFQNNEPLGEIIIHKTNDNGDSVSGAEFTITANEAINNVAGTVQIYTPGQVVGVITTDDEGKASLNNLPLGKYNVQETKAPEGYLLNKTVYPANLEFKNDSTAKVEITVGNIVNNEPKGEIVVYKTNDNGDSVSGAEFTITAMEDIYNVAHTKQLYSNGQQVAIITTDSNGKASKNNLPMGKYQVKETNVPTGYLLNNTTFPVSLEYKDSTTPVIEIRLEDVINYEPTGELSLIKTDKETGNDDRIDMSSHHGDATLNGAVYTLYATTDIHNVANTVEYFSKDEEIATFTFNEYGVPIINITNNTTKSKINVKGNILAGLPMGSYYAKETVIPEGYLQDTTIYNYNFVYKDMNTETISTSGTVYNQVKKAPFEIIKVSTNDNTTAEVIEGAEFTAILKKYVDYFGSFEEAMKHFDEYAEDEYCTFTTGENGHGISSRLSYGTYTVEETYTPSPEIETVEPFNVFINKESTTPIRELIENDLPFEAYIKLQKQDKETEKFVTYSNTTFELYKLNEETNEWEQVKCKVGNKYYSSWTTDEQGIARTETKLEAGTYKVNEQIVPEGYIQLDEELIFEINNENPTLEIDEDWDAWITVTVKNSQPTGTLIIDKNVSIRNEIDTSLVDISDLSEIQFRLTAKEDIIDYADGSVIYEQGKEILTFNLDTEGNYTIENLPLGIYSLQEIQTLNGLALDENIYDINLIQEDTITKVYEITEELENKTTVTEFSKTDITGDAELEGAKLTLLDENNEVVIDSWISTNVSHKIEGLEVGKVYLLIEEIAPDGYVVSNGIRFEVENTGEIQKVTMVDKVVEMSKVDISGNEIEGATIQVLDENGDIVDEWISEKEPHKIKNLVEGATYVLHEEIAVDEYVKATDIEFTVTEEKETQKLEMIDKIVEVTKTDYATGEEIEGAELTVTDEDGNIIDSWTSTKEPHKVRGLEEGKTYTLTEITCPYGYEQAESITFTVTEDKETQKIEMKDMPILKNIRLIKLDGDTKEIIYDNFTFGIYSDETCTELIEEKNADITTGTITFENLRYGTYYIKELKAPNGYYLSDRIAKVEINDKGVFIDGELIEQDNDNMYSFEYYNFLMPVIQTGNEINYTLLIVLSIISSFGIIMGFIKLRKINSKNNNRS